MDDRKHTAITETGHHRTMPLPDRDDRETIRKTLKGDQRAFERIVLKYQRMLYAVVIRIVRSHDDTDDILQECFLRAYRHLAEFDLSRPLYPWLRQIAANQAISLLRRQARLQPVENPDIFPSTENETSRYAERDEFDQALQRAIDTLPVEQRTVLLLRVHENMSYQELSQTLGIEIGTVMSRLARARAKLRNLMRPHLAERRTSA